MFQAVAELFERSGLAITFVISLFTPTGLLTSGGKCKSMVFFDSIMIWSTTRF